MSGSFSVGDKVSHSGLVYIVLAQTGPDFYFIARAYSFERVESFSVSGECLTPLDRRAAIGYSVVNTDDLEILGTLEEAREETKTLLDENPAPTSFTIVSVHEAWESKVTIKQIQ